MSGTPSKRPLQQVLLATACALALAACGDDDPAEPATTPQTTSPAAEASPLRERLNSLMSGLLTQRGLDREVAECAVGELGETVSDDELESAIKAIRRTGAAPTKLTEAAIAAGEACGQP